MAGALGPSGARAENDAPLMRYPDARPAPEGARPRREAVPRESHWREAGRGPRGEGRGEGRGAARAFVEAPETAPPEAAVVALVLGDFLADGLAGGLATAYAGVPGFAVARKARGDSGLVRDDVVDWPRRARELLASPEAAGRERVVGLVLLGANDRQPLRDPQGGDGRAAEPLSERWRALYAARADALIAAFAERGVPLLWVGLPPARAEGYAADLAAINALARERVERAALAGAPAAFVDPSNGFVDAEGRFAASGPDVDGRPARLRGSDGVSLTRAGARKLAYFVERDLARLAGVRPQEAPLPDTLRPEAPRPDAPGAGEARAAALPGAGPTPEAPRPPAPGGADPPGAADLPLAPALGPLGPGAPSGPPPGLLAALPPPVPDADEATRRALPGYVPPALEALLPPRPEPPGPAAVPVRPAAGPLLPLTTPPASPGARLAGSGPPAGPASLEARVAVDEALERGRPPAPKPGRGDDFPWPPR